MEAELRNQRSRIRWSALAIAGNLVILVMKVVAYYWTDSAALRSDALESSVNVVASSLALLAIIVGNRPADRNHPYGHGKIEFFSAAFEGALISVASVMILYGVARNYLRGTEVHDLNRGLWLNIAAGSLNGALGWGLLQAGQRLHSQALIADGHHILSDFWTTVGLAVGLGIASVTGWYWLDPLIAVALGLLLIRTGVKLIREAASALLDSEDPALIASLVDAINALDCPDVITVHELRAMRAGRYLHVDMHVVVPEFYEVGHAHDRVEAFAAETLARAGLVGECHTHTDPCRRLYCAGCRVEPCPIRREPFRGREDLTPNAATAAPAGE